MRRLIFCIVAAVALATGSARAGEREDKALIIAAAKGDLGAADAALAAGASPNAEVKFDGDAVSPLAAAVFGGELVIVERLLALGADPRWFEADAVQWAIWLDDGPMARSLIAAMGPPRRFDEALVLLVPQRLSKARASEIRANYRAGFSKASPEVALREYPFSLGQAETPDGDGFRMAVDAIAAAGYPLDLRTETGFSAADLALRRGDEALLAYLLAKGAPHAPDVVRRAEAQARLGRAVGGGDADAVRTALASGADPALPDENGQHVLPLAARNGAAEIVALLLDAGARPDDVGPDQTRAVVIAAQRGDTAILSALLAKGARREPSGHISDWPLRAAARRGQTRAMEILVANGADVNALMGGESVLHGFVQGDGFMSGYIRLDEGQLAVPATLKALGFDFRNPSFRRSLVESNLIPGDSDFDLLDSLSEAGAPVDEATAEAAIRNGPAALIRWMLAHGVTPHGGLLRVAADVLPDEAAMTALLDAGAPAPTDPDEARDLLEDVINGDGPAVFARLLRAGPPIQSGDRFKLLEQMVRRGRAPMIRIALQHGFDASATDGEGRTVLHKLVREDAASRAVIGPREAPALAALIDGGLDLAKADRWGATAVNAAAAKPATQVRLQTVLGAAGAASTPLHKAVRANDRFAVARLIRGGANIDAEDDLGRTALTLALQMKRDAIAEHLLLTNAKVSFRAPNAFQIADVDQAMSREVATALRIRLLSERLLSIDPNGAGSNPDASLDAFRADQERKLDDLHWRVITESGWLRITWDLFGHDDWEKPTRDPNSYDNVCCRSTRTEKGDLTTFELHQLHVYSYLKMAVDAQFTIPGCTYSSATQPTCYPRVEITNPNGGGAFEFQSGVRVEKPAMTMVVEQAGQPATTLSAGETRVFDRSLGALGMTLGPRKAELFGSELRIRWKSGPALVPAVIDEAGRTRLYVEIARLQRELAEVEAKLDSVDRITRAKTLRTAIHVLSARAVKAQFGKAAQERAQQTAEGLARLDQNLTSLHQALNAANAVTADDLDVQIASLDVLIRACRPEACDDYRRARATLAANRATMASSSAALETLLGQFETEVDRQARQYQAAVLESAQFLDNATLATLIPSDVRNAIRGKLVARDVLVPDAAVGGAGRELRRNFGLPDPAP